MKYDESIASIMTPDVHTVGIAGHVHPDGDCVGACMGLYLYLREQYPACRVDVYLEKIRDSYMTYISDCDEAKSVCTDESYDCFFLLDASSLDRVGVAKEAFGRAKKTVCIDHHITNTGLADINVIDAASSSASEVLYELTDPEKVSRKVADAIYLGIIQDTGVFQYSCTSPRTMEIAGKLMEKGVPFTEMIVDTFFVKTFLQNQILGRTLLESTLLLDGRCLMGFVSRQTMDFYHVKPIDLDGIVNQMRNTKGVEVALFLYETNTQEFKVSMRSAGKVDVSEIATYFGGGGHKRAAGCTMQGTVYDVTNNITQLIEKQLQA